MRRLASSKRVRWCAHLVLLVPAVLAATSARGAFELPPPDGAGPAAGTLAIASAPSAAAVFANPAGLAAGEVRCFAAAGVLYGMRGLRRGALALSCPLGAGGAGFGAAVLGDSLYGEEVVAAGVAWRFSRSLGAGAAVRAGRVTAAGRPGPWMRGGALGITLARGRVRAALTLAGDAYPGGGARLLAGAGLSFTPGSAPRVTVARRETFAPLAFEGARGSSAWSIAQRLGGIEIFALAESGGSVGVGVRAFVAKATFVTSETLHPLLGETPEAALELSW